MGENLELSEEKSCDIISYKRALNLLLSLTDYTDLDSETLPLDKCLDRVLSVRVKALIDNPNQDVSSMDGYAINSLIKTKNNIYRVVDISAAGKPSNIRLTSNEAVRIFTGAHLPQGSNTVIIQENIEILKKNKILVHQDTNSIVGENIRKKGADFSKGSIISPGIFISDKDAMLFASMGYKELSVKKRPSISIISVGDELIEPGEGCKDNKIYSSNAYGISSLLKKYACQPMILPITPDNLSAIKESLNYAVMNSDCIVTCGGASVGSYDLVRKAARELGLKMFFEKVNIRPGKPTFAGLLKKVPMLGLPGNPVSSYVCARLFLIPFISRVIGCKEKYPIISSAKLFSDLKQNGSRQHFMRGNIEIKDGEQIVYLKDRQDSSLVKTLQESNCLIIRPPNDKAKRANEIVDIMELR
ncbi:MAG: molybdopterin molybdotransferase MoeA [Paracoccaceae bacterium]